LARVGSILKVSGTVWAQEGGGAYAEKRFLKLLDFGIPWFTPRAKIIGVNNMGKKMLESEEVKEQIAKALAGGVSQDVIAQTLGVSQSTISRLVGKVEVKDLVEREGLKLLEVLPTAVENVKDLVREMKDIPKGEIKRRELSYKASLDVLRVGALMPTPIQSQVIQNFLNFGTNIISPVIEKILQHIQIQDSSDLPPLEVNFKEED
jgi:hypothetical protein